MIPAKLYTAKIVRVDFHIRYQYNTECYIPEYNIIFYYIDKHLHVVRSDKPRNIYDEEEVSPLIDISLSANFVTGLEHICILEEALERFRQNNKKEALEYLTSVDMRDNPV